MTIVPSPIAEVCYVGDRLQVTCNASSDTFLRWRFDYTFENGTTDQSFSEITTASSLSNFIISMNNPKTDIVLTITRESARHATPLVATADYNAVSRTLNRTIITCLEFDETSVASTTVNIAMESNGKSH